jgi:flavin reductase (DIM6/NTAB) family NADH-FMN oxidoreductase RutF
MAIDAALFRQVAGSFASGVTVITTGREGAYHGMTASAFSSLSLEPPLILVCIDRQAETLPILLETGAFNVNILNEDQEHLSRSFAAKDSPEAHGLANVDYEVGEMGLPLLHDTLAFFECRIAEHLDGGDHVILVGEVVNAGAREELEPLMYYRGRYRHFDNLAAQTSPGAAPRSDLT